MIDRLFILIALAALVALALPVLRAWQASRLRSLQHAAADSAASPLADVVHQGPALLYFTTDDCAQCRFQQRPVLDRLSALAPIPVVTLDAVQREDLARHFGILTVPSTVVLDARRAPVAINHGVAPLHKLQMQVAPLLNPAA